MGESVEQAEKGSYRPILVGPLTNGLLQYDPIENTKIIGELAERWETSPGGKTYAFFLHKGVKWHDGAPFSAADVKYTFGRLLDPNDPQAADFASKRESLSVIDRTTAPLDSCSTAPLTPS